MASTMSKPFDARIHCAIDYVSTAILLAAPILFGLKGAARTVSLAFGVAAGGLTAVTNQPFAIKRLVSFRVHGLVDTPFVPLLLLLPWATGALKQRNARLFFGAFFAWVLVNYSLTNYNSEKD